MDYHGWIAIFFGVSGVVSAALTWQKYGQLDHKYHQDISRFALEMVEIKKELAELRQSDRAKDQIIREQGQRITALETENRQLKAELARREWGGDK